MTNSNMPNSGMFSWKGVIIAVIISVVFMGTFYLAMHTEPDYMPSQQKKIQHQLAVEEAERNGQPIPKASVHGHGTDHE